MDWERGALIGRGSSSVVHQALRLDLSEKKYAVKSAPASASASLRREEAILADLHSCPHIISCYGHDITTDSICGGVKTERYNLFLEYAGGGSLSNVIHRAGGGLPEMTVRRYLRSILLGIRHVHAMGYAHCDIKPHNILLSGGVVKIADFGLAKRSTEKASENVAGTPMYMAPESASRNEYGLAADIWAFGCTVAEMVSGRRPWNRADHSEAGTWALLLLIGSGDAVPDIPSTMSEEGKHFLRCCFEKEPSKRWTAEMLLSHPYAAPLSESDFAEEAAGVADCSDFDTSPQSVLGYSFSSVPWTTPAAEIPGSDLFGFTTQMAKERIAELALEELPDWASFSGDGWINVRKDSSTSN